MEVDSEDQARVSKYNKQPGATLDPYAGWMLNFLGGESRVFRRAEPGSLGMFTMATPVANLRPHCIARAQPGAIIHGWSWQICWPVSLRPSQRTLEH